VALSAYRSTPIHAGRGRCHRCAEMNDGAGPTIEEGWFALPGSVNAVTTEMLERLVEAFNAHDTGAVMGFFAEDCPTRHASWPRPVGATPHRA